jgi:O-acetyl-ADP-ribose deacetylase
MNDPAPSSATLQVGPAQLELVIGDITRQNGFSAIVNAANADLAPGGGVAGAIHQAAGPELARECAPLGPIRPGEAVLTAAYDLPNRFVIHCLGPVYNQDRPSDKLLASCYRNALEIADLNQIDAIAFPAISTGAFGYPMGEAAEVALRSLQEVLRDRKHVRRVRLVLADAAAMRTHLEAAERVFGKST